MTAIAACEVRNPSIEPQTLPPPLSGQLAPGQAIVLPISAANLLAIAPSLNQTGTCTVTDLPAYSGPLDTGYLSAPTKRLIPFNAATVAASAAASSTLLGGTLTDTMNVVPGRAGRVTGLFGEMGSAVSGTQQLTLDVYKNGSKLSAGGFDAEALLTAGNKKFAQTLDGNDYAFAATDELSVRLTTSSGWSNTGSPLLGFLEIEC